MNQVKLPPISVSDKQEMKLPSLVSLTKSVEDAASFQTPPQSHHHLHNDSTVIQNDDTTMIDANSTTTEADKPASVDVNPLEVIVVNSKDVFSAIGQFPRQHLGSILYDDNAVIETIQYKLVNLNKEDSMQIDAMARLPPRTTIEVIPDFISHYLNCTLDIHIPRYKTFNNSNVFSRKVWGTDVYTDDSDIVSVLYHCGILKSISPLDDDLEIDSRTPEVDSKTDDITYYPKSIVGVTVANTKSIFSVQQDHHGIDHNEVDDMLVVRIVILPALETYQGCFRNNYNSRSWLSIHDGGSIAIQHVRWDFCGRRRWC